MQVLGSENSWVMCLVRKCINKVREDVVSRAVWLAKQEIRRGSLTC